MTNEQNTGWSDCSVTVATCDPDPDPNPRRQRQLRLWVQCMHPSIHHKKIHSETHPACCLVRVCCNLNPGGTVDLPPQPQPIAVRTTNSRAPSPAVPPASATAHRRRRVPPYNTSILALGAPRRKEGGAQKAEHTDPSSPNPTRCRGLAVAGQNRTEQERAVRTRARLAVVRAAAAEQKHATPPAAGAATAVPYSRAGRRKKRVGVNLAGPTHSVARPAIPNPPARPPPSIRQSRDGSRCSVLLPLLSLLLLLLLEGRERERENHSRAGGCRCACGQALAHRDCMDLPPFRPPITVPRHTRLHRPLQLRPCTLP